MGAKKLKTELEMVKSNPGQEYRGEELFLPGEQLVLEDLVAVAHLAEHLAHGLAVHGVVAVHLGLSNILEDPVGLDLGAAAWVGEWVRGWV